MQKKGCVFLVFRNFNGMIEIECQRGSYFSCWQKKIIRKRTGGREYEDEIFEAAPLGQTGKMLLLNPIPEKERISDKKILEQAVKEAYEAVEKGEYFHPAANGAIDRLTDGKSSDIQLVSIVENAKLAEKLIKD